jgi:beta-mannosidase
LNKPLDDLRKDHAPEEVYLYSELKKGGETLSSNVFHFTPLKRVSLPEPEIRPEVFERDGRVIVRLGAARLAKTVYLSAPGFKERFSDNFFDLIPGLRHEVTFLTSLPVDIASFKQALRVVSLRDTY